MLAGAAGGVAVAVSTALARRTRELASLRASRARLVAHALDSENRERRRLAEVLHDEAIQNLLAAAQELGEAEQEDPAGLYTASLHRTRTAIERTVAELRDAIFDLYPPVLEHVGLEAALQALLERWGRRGGFQATVEVAPEAARVDDEMVLALSRELVSNAARHAGASEVSLRLVHDGHAILLEVADDGRGFDEARRSAAVREGHIGLVASAERVEALGGSFTLDSTPGKGTRVRVRIPIQRERRRAPRPAAADD